MAKKKTQNEFENQVYQLSDGEYEVLGRYKGDGTKILLKHSECGYEYEATPSNFINGKRCPKCAGRVLMTIDEVKKWLRENSNCKVLSKSHNNSREKLEFQCECGEVFKRTFNNFKKSSRSCNKCSKTIRWNIDTIREYCNKETTVELLSNKYNNAYDILKFKCSCGRVFEKSWNNFYSKEEQRICPNCNRIGMNGKTHEQFVWEVSELVEDEYVVLSKYKHSEKKIKMQHKECNTIYSVTPNNFLMGNRCPYCRSSKAEKIIEEWLTRKKINFKGQYTFEDCRHIQPLRFDFAILDDSNNLTMLIEYQGKQHYEPATIFGGEEAFKLGQKRDKIKKAYCKNNNIKLLEIPYTKFNKLEEILKSAI